MSESDARKRQVAETFGRGADSYNQAPFFREFGRRLVGMAAITKGASVLDIATGRGAVLFPAAEMAGPHGALTGIDVAEPMVQATAADARKRGLANVDVRVMDAENLTFADASFDFVLCGFGIMFLPNLHQALLEMRRVMRPGASLAVSTWASLGELSRRYRQLLQAYSVLPSPASQTFETPEKLEAALGRAGFSDMRVKTESLTEICPDAETWWSRATGGLYSGVGKEMEPDLREELKREVLAMLQDFSQADGVHEMRSANLAVASALR